MKWINVTDSLPSSGKDVVVVCDYLQTGNYQYEIAFFCCRNGWRINRLIDHLKVIKWAELPPIEPE
jgi:hypothetical protein